MMFCFGYPFISQPLGLDLPKSPTRIAPSRHSPQAPARGPARTLWYPPVPIKAFVETPRYAGAVYRASGRTRVGASQPTAGRIPVPRPVYERIGTGTVDMIRRCAENGLPEPWVRGRRRIRDDSLAPGAIRPPTNHPRSDPRSHPRCCENAVCDSGRNEPQADPGGTGING